MTSEQDLLKLVAQAHWANTKWVEVVYGQPTLDARARELLAHILLGERIWFARIAGQQVAATTSSELAKEELLRGLAGGALRTRGSTVPERRPHRLPDSESAVSGRPCCCVCPPGG